MWMVSNPGAMVHDLRTRLGAVATALVGRDGSVLYADLPGGTYAETFAIMCATMVGAAVTANAELGRARPARVLVAGADSVTLIVESGPKALVVVVMDPGTDLAASEAVIAEFAAALASV